jgi:hypothetical protein
VNVTPASSESTVVPAWPAATTRVAAANAAVKTGAVEGVTEDAVAPPSVVRSSRSPLPVAITQTSTPVQEMPVRSSPAGAPSRGRVVHVWPPSVDTSSAVPLPTAYMVSGATTARLFRRWGTLARTTHEFAPSVVLSSLPDEVAAMPASGVVKTIAAGSAGPPTARVSGMAVRRPNVLPPSSLRRTVPSWVTT